MGQTWDLFKAILGLGDVRNMATAYLQFLKKLAKWSIIVTILLLPLPIIGSLMHISWMNGLYLAIIGLLITIWLIAAFPIINTYKKVDLIKIKKMAKTIGGVLFWILLLAIYFYLVPVWNYPAAIPLVFIICAILALGFMRFGIGINPKIAIGMVLIIFCLITISFYMPVSHSAINTSVGWLDRSVAEFITTPERRALEEQKRQEEVAKSEGQRRVEEREAFFNRYLLSRSFINRPDRREVAVLAVEESNRISYELTQKIASLLKTPRLKVTDSLFTGRFVSDGLFQRIFGGNGREVKNLDLSKYVDHIVLCKKAVNFTENPEMQNMITAHTIVEIHIISANTGIIEDSFTISEVGAGFSKRASEDMAKERIIKKLAEKDWRILNEKE